jgi:WD40 repeat protein
MLNMSYIHDAPTLKASQQGLEIVERFLKLKGWTKTSTSRWWVEANSSRMTLRRFWHPEKHQISRQTFIDICRAVGIQDWQSIVDIPIPDDIQPNIDLGVLLNESLEYQDWGEAPDVENFYGREAELTQLEQLIVVEQSKLVMLLGMGGIGKTTLTVALADQLQNKFDRFIWRSLRDAPPLEEILSELIPFLSQPEQIEVSDDIERQLKQIMKALSQHRCLLVLDNIESILDSDTGHYWDGYENYGNLFRRIAEERHQSCLILTSREQIPEFSRLSGKKVRSLSVKGLSPKAGRELLFKVGEIATSEVELQAILEHYAGNPLALKMVAASVRDLLGSDISEFLKLLQQGNFIFRDIEDLLQRQFDRLSDLEKEVMYGLAIAREPISMIELQADLLSIRSKQNLVSTLESLRQRSLIEIITDDNLKAFTLQPVVMEYVSNRAIAKVCEEISTEKPELLKRHALVKVQAQDYIRQAQIRVILELVIENLLSVYETVDNVKTILLKRIFALQGRSTFETGYAGGNLLNMLCQLPIEFTGCDFSSLTLWQADLRNIELQRVNFRGSNLAKSVFTETFGSITSVVFHPEGDRIAASDSKGWIYLWRVSDGKQLLAFEAYQDWCMFVAFSPDGKTLASDSLNQTAKLWDAYTGQYLKTLQENTAGVATSAFSPDNRLFVCASGDRTVKVTDLETGECLVLQGHENIVRFVAFSPNGQLLASCSSDRTIKIWDIASGNCLQNLSDNNGILTIAFSPDSQLIASTGDDPTVKIWQIDNGQCIKALHGHQDRNWWITFSPDGTILASGGDDKTVKLWDLSTCQCLRTLQEHQGSIWSLAFSPDGQFLVTGSEDRTLKIWEAATGYCLRRLQGYHCGMIPFAFDSSGDRLFTHGDDQKVRIWDINSGLCLKTLSKHTKGFWQVSLNEDQKMIATAELDYSVGILNLENGEVIRKMAGGHTAWVRMVSFSPDGHFLASGSEDQTVRLWDVLTGKCLQILRGHTGPIQCVTFNRVGQLASGGWDGTVRLWNILTYECQLVIQAHNHRILSLAFNTDGNLLASSSQDRTIALWDSVTGKCMRKLELDSSNIFAIAFSPDGQILSACVDTVIRLWKVSTGENLATLTGHIGQIGSIVFSPNGVLASGSSDGSTKLWNLENYQCIKTLQLSRPYEEMNIQSISGLSEAQKISLRSLGAID